MTTNNSLITRYLPDRQVYTCYPNLLRGSLSSSPSGLDSARLFVHPIVLTMKRSTPSSFEVPSLRVPLHSTLRGRSVILIIKLQIPIESSGQLFSSISPILKSLHYLFINSQISSIALVPSGIGNNG